MHSHFANRLVLPSCHRQTISLACLVNVLQPNPSPIAYPPTEELWQDCESRRSHRFGLDPWLLDCVVIYDNLSGDREVFR